LATKGTTSALRINCPIQRIDGFSPVFELDGRTLSSPFGYTSVNLCKTSLGFEI
jgi:hypothetical protein